MTEVVEGEEVVEATGLTETEVAVEIDDLITGPIVTDVEIERGIERGITQVGYLNGTGTAIQFSRGAGIGTGIETEIGTGQDDIGVESGESVIATGLLTTTTMTKRIETYEDATARAVGFITSDLMGRFEDSSHLQMTMARRIS